MWYNLKWVLCMEEKIKETINIIKPYLNSDGGDIEYVSYKDNIVYVKMHGAFCFKNNSRRSSRS